SISVQEIWVTMLW
nr:immunoglobulin heavy chain junction region [Mus musculus]